MESLGYLMDGFAVALTGRNLLLCFVGCLWGTAVGVLPGLGPLAGMALLLPLTFKLDPAGAVIMRAEVQDLLVRPPSARSSVGTDRLLDGLLPLAAGNVFGHLG
ncbi:tripartite tricarboxylate transporter permease, partial [Rhodoplanes roseus]